MVGFAPGSSAVGKQLLCHECCNHCLVIPCFFTQRIYLFVLTDTATKIIDTLILSVTTFRES